MEVTKEALYAGDIYCLVYYSGGSNTKFLTVRYLKPLKSVPLLEGLLRLTYVENRGAAFGILQNQVVLIVLPVLVIGAMIFYLIFTGRTACY